MPQIGWSEILVIVVLTIIIIGPKDIPIVLRKVGSSEKKEPEKELNVDKKK